MRSLWRDERASFAGEFVHFEKARMNPKPIAGDKLPVYFGGESMPALRRVAEIRHRMAGVEPEPGAKPRKEHSLLRQMFTSNGRDPNQLRVMMMPGVAHFSPDHLGGYRDAGVDEVVVLVNQTANQQDNISKLEHLAKRWNSSPPRS